MSDRCYHSCCRRLIASLALAIHGVINAQVAYPLPVAELPLAGAAKLEFCIVPLEIGDAPFATREFWLGGRGKGGFKEPPTRTLISGSVVLQVGGKPDWCLLMGKTEVTVAQWNTVMGLPAAPEAEANFPVTRKSKAEIFCFLEKLNEYLYSNRGKPLLELPFNGSPTQIFFRLPSEAEWEYAARGGRAVDATRFDSPTPYKNETNDFELNRFEWFAGQKSSKGVPKPVGLLEANPLGLYDMLGNVSEIVESHFQIEYSQGRFGGLVLRGGDFRTDEKDVRASLRFETPCVFEDDGKAYRASNAGFRLAIGSMIIPNVVTVENLENAWAAHKDQRIQPATAISGVASLREAVINETDEMRKQADEMRKQIKDLAEKKEMGAAERDAAVGRISTLEALIASLEGKVKRAEELSSLSAIRLGSMTSLAVTWDITTLDYNRQNRDDQLAAISERNISDARKVVEDSCKLLGETTPAIVERQFGEWEQVLKERGAERQLEATRVFRKAAFEYMKNRRLDMDSWLNSLNEIASSKNDQ
jgi:hypothetical protein